VEDVLDKAGELTSGLAQAVSGALGALLGGGTDGAPKPVKEMIEQVANVVGNLSQALGELLGGDGGPAPAGQLVEQVANVMGNLAQALGELLVGGADRAPEPATNNNPLAQPLAQPLPFLYERTTELFRGGGELVGQMAQAADEALSGGGGLANQHQQQHASGEPVAPSEPSAPPVAPIPAVPPLAPGGGSAPVGYSSFLLGASGSSASVAFQLLFAILIVFSVALLQGGKLSWQRREAHGPPSAPILAIERPG
jgi:hypothetical protein